MRLTRRGKWLVAILAIVAYSLLLNAMGPIDTSGYLDALPVCPTAP